jgi:short-subunit dehydrogenase
MISVAWNGTGIPRRCRAARAGVAVMAPLGYCGLPQHGWEVGGGVSVNKALKLRRVSDLSDKITHRYFFEKLVVITGGTSGIGLAVATELQHRRARIVILADKGPGVEQALQRLGGRSNAVDGYVCDIGTPQSVTKVAADILSAHGAPDILINNAGFATYRTFEEEDSLEIERLMSVNFAGAIRVTKAFIGPMIERRSGQIINVASIAGVLALTPNAIYCGAKHAMIAWSKCLAAETARFGIHVSVVCPGRVETSFFDHETFRQRTFRKETALTVPMASVVDGILRTIVRRRRMCFIPRYFGAVAWAVNALGPIAQRPLDRLMRARVEDIYRAKSSR